MVPTLSPTPVTPTKTLAKLLDPFRYGAKLSLYNAVVIIWITRLRQSKDFNNSNVYTCNLSRRGYSFTYSWLVDLLTKISSLHKQKISVVAEWSAGWRGVLDDLGPARRYICVDIFQSSPRVKITRMLS